jgi:hypothetical protein
MEDTSSVYLLGTLAYITAEINDSLTIIDVGGAFNPKLSSDLSSGGTFNVTWTLNASGTNHTEWMLGVLFNSSYGSANVSDNHTSNISVCIGSTCFGEGPPPPTDCTPTLNQDWSITDEQVCNGVEKTTGTGNIFIETGGTLFLINGANVTTSGLELRTTGDQVFIDTDSELRIL